MLRRTAAVLLLAFCLPAHSQVALCPSWVATVDTASSQIVLRWAPSPSTRTLGYHICTGSPCLDFDTVFGRFDTSYHCITHDPAEPHLYRLHVFDSSYNVSPLTPFFGNMVLSAVVPPCDSVAAVSWTPAVGLPAGLGSYTLLARFAPTDTAFQPVYSVDSAGPLACSVLIPVSATSVSFLVKAVNADASVESLSNMARAARATVDTAAYFSITDASADPYTLHVTLSFDLDTAFTSGTYTLWRSRNNEAFCPVHSFLPPLATYVDRDISRRDTVAAYRLSVTDACGFNERRSSIRVLFMPDPLEPGVALPNTLIAGDPLNGTFHPVTLGALPDDYRLDIYNRLGLLVFSSTDPSAAWTPRSDTPQGVYSYALHVSFADGSAHTYVGTVTLIK